MCKGLGLGRGLIGLGSADGGRRGGGEVDEKKGRGTVYRILKGRWKRRKKGRGEAERRGR